MKVFLVLLLALVLPAPVASEGRALLIGIGHYQIPGADLPGVDRDLEFMQEVARWLGYPPAAIRTLSDADATLEKVESFMGSWLKEGLAPDDPVLIYFSGHGTRIPDENGDEGSDGADEVLMMYDARPVEHDGQPTLDGVLVDDRFSELLRALPSRRVLVLVDACHSGSAVKDLDRLLGDQPMTKAYTYPGMPAGGGALLFEDDSANYLAISAAGDEEEALPSPEGSYFTRGIHQALRQARRLGLSVTPRDIAAASRRYIYAQVRPAYGYSPRISGNPRLATRPLPLVDLSRR